MEAPATLILKTTDKDTSDRRIEAARHETIYGATFIAEHGGQFFEYEIDAIDAEAVSRLVEALLAEDRKLKVWAHVTDEPEEFLIKTARGKVTSTVLGFDLDGAEDDDAEYLYDRWHSGLPKSVQCGQIGATRKGPSRSTQRFLDRLYEDLADNKPIEKHLETLRNLPDADFRILEGRREDIFGYLLRVGNLARGDDIIALVQAAFDAGFDKNTTLHGDPLPLQVIDWITRETWNGLDNPDRVAEIDGATRLLDWLLEQDIDLDRVIHEDDHDDPRAVRLNEVAESERQKYLHPLSYRCHAEDERLDLWCRVLPRLERATLAHVLATHASSLEAGAEAGSFGALPSGLLAAVQVELARRDAS